MKSVQSEKFVVTPELTQEGLKSIVQVALAANDPVMCKSWEEYSPLLLSHVDAIPDDALRSLLRIPFWSEKILSQEARYNLATRERLERLIPRSMVGSVVQHIRQAVRWWSRLSIPDGLEIADVEEIMQRFNREMRGREFMHVAQRMDVMNGVLQKYFGGSPQPISIRLYFYHRSEVGLSDAG